MRTAGNIKKQGIATRGIGCGEKGDRDSNALLFVCSVVLFFLDLNLWRREDNEGCRSPKSVEKKAGLLDGGGFSASSGSCSVVVDQFPQLNRRHNPQAPAPTNVGAFAFLL